MPPKNWQLEGQKFGRLTAIEIAGQNKDGRVIYKCLCECGKYVPILAKLLSNGATRSCGCLKSDITKERNTKAGKAHGQAASPTYSSWRAMLRRCLIPGSPSYEHYGGRGITVCERWMDIRNFIEDMGIRPGTRYSIDRIDCNGNYEKSNCRWATKKEQSRNRNCCHKVTLMGRTATVAEWSEISGIPDSTIYQRLAKGMPVEEVFSYRI